MHDENQHPRGRDGRWVAKPAGAPPVVSLTGSPGGLEQAALRRIQGLLDGPWDWEALDGITGLVAATGRGAAFGDDEHARRRWRPTSYADPLDRVALALRSGRYHGWQQADQMQALHEALQDNGHVIVLDGRGDYWARQEDTSWR